MKKEYLLAVFFFFLVAPAVHASEFRCPEQPHIVIASTQSNVDGVICRTATETIGFLARYGLYPQRTIRLRIVESTIVSEGYDSYGRYDSRSDTIDLMSYRAIMALPEKAEMYDEPFDAIHYLGAVAHEVAHGVMQHNLETELISPAPQEYLAHAAQLAALPEARRERIIRAMDVGPWEPGDAISDIYMALQPGKFAVKSYTHLTSLAEPEAFVRILLNANWFYVYVPD